MNQNLAKAEVGMNYTVTKIDTTDEEMKRFLITLGCFPGEEVTLISALNQVCVVVIKGARYSIDKELAEAIIIQ